VEEVEVDLEEVHREERGEEDQIKKESLGDLCFRSFISICTITIREQRNTYNTQSQTLQ